MSKQTVTMTPEFYEAHKPETEPGEATLHVQLSNGQLIVRHTNSRGAILLRGPLPVGGWTKIVENLLRAAPDAVGFMRHKGWSNSLGRK